MSEVLVLLQSRAGDTRSQSLGLPVTRMFLTVHTVPAINTGIGDQGKFLSVCVRVLFRADHALKSKVRVHFGGCKLTAQYQFKLCPKCFYLKILSNFCPKVQEYHGHIQ